VTWNGREGEEQSCDMIKSRKREIRREKKRERSRKHWKVHSEMFYVTARSNCSKEIIMI
jgi:hypothetical protein